MFPSFRCPKEIGEVDVGAPQECPKGATGDFLVIRHRERRDVALLDEDDVAPFLPCDLPPEPDEGLGDLASGEERQLFGQTETST